MSTKYNSESIRIIEFKNEIMFDIVLSFTYSQYCKMHTKYQNSWKLLNIWCIYNLQWFHHDSIIISLLPFHFHAFPFSFFITCIGCWMQPLLNPMQMQFQSIINFSNELYCITKPMELCNMETVMWYPSVNLLDE